jgi:hypothetical protein
MVQSQSSVSRGSVDLVKVGVLEVPKLTAGLVVIIATTVVVVGGNLREVLKSGKVGLMLGASGFAVL